MVNNTIYIRVYVYICIYIYITVCVYLFVQILLLLYLQYQRLSGLFQPIDAGLQHAQFLIELPHLVLSDLYFFVFGRNEFVVDPQQSLQIGYGVSFVSGRPFQLLHVVLESLDLVRQVRDRFQVPIRNRFRWRFLLMFFLRFRNAYELYFISRSTSSLMDLVYRSFNSLS